MSRERSKAFKSRFKPGTCNGRAAPSGMATCSQGQTQERALLSPSENLKRRSLLPQARLAAPIRDNKFRFDSAASRRSPAVPSSVEIGPDRQDQETSGGWRRASPPYEDRGRRSYRVSSLSPRTPERLLRQGLRVKRPAIRSRASRSSCSQRAMRCQDPRGAQRPAIEHPGGATRRRCVLGSARLPQGLGWQAGAPYRAAPGWDHPE